MSAEGTAAKASSFPVFRRVIVTTSLMNRKLGMIIPCRMEGKEIYWCIPDPEPVVEEEPGYVSMSDFEDVPHEMTKAAV